MDSSARGRTTELKPLVNSSNTPATAEPLVPATLYTAEVEQVSEPVTLPSTDCPVPGIATNEPPPRPPAEETVPESNSSDPAQSNGTKYPWLFMAKTLEACFNNSEEGSKEEYLWPQDPVTGEVSGSSDQPTHSEQTAESDDGLLIDSFTKSAPKLMQAFLSHSDVCTRVEAEALQLATNGDPDPDEDSPLQVYMNVLERLEKLLDEALELESSILEFTNIHSGVGPLYESPEEDEASARQKVLGVFERCLPVLRARISNLRIAQELTDGAQENLSITLRMESLGL